MAKRKKRSSYLDMARTNRDNWLRQAEYYRRGKKKYKAEAKKKGKPSGFFGFFGL